MGLWNFLAIAVIVSGVVAAYKCKKCKCCCKDECKIDKKK